MRTEEEIKKRIHKAQRNKACAKERGDDKSYLRWVWLEKELRWILE